MVPGWVTTLVVLVATLAWLGNLLAAMLDKGYEASEAVNAVMLAIVGGIFAVARGRRDKDDE